MLFQGGALWSSMTLAENIALPLQRYMDLSPQELREQACLKLALTGLAGFEDYYPAEISGGMRKRAGLARALALDPEIIFLDMHRVETCVFSSFFVLVNIHKSTFIAIKLDFCIKNQLIIEEIQP